MTRWPRLWSLLTGKPLTDPRAQAMADLRAAEARRDDRDIGRARMRLMAATHDELARKVLR